ncbi:uncharacterized protein [Pseudorasbora parva]|uniref:uncharacterized protein n=1 Tax=Pseudorasbora parva TaxID=51549 RepID=UPI00351DFBE5
MEPALPLHLDNESLLHYEQALSEMRDDLDPTDTQPVRTEDVRWLETSPHVMRSMHTSDYSLHPNLRFEESLQGFEPNTFNQEFNTTSVHPSDPQEGQNRFTQPPSASLNSPRNINPFHTPYLNPSWPVLVPHFSPHQSPFCSFYLPPFNPVVSCGDSAFSCLVLRQHLSVYPVRPSPLLRSEPRPLQYEPRPPQYEPRPLQYEPRPLQYEPRPLQYEPRPLQYEPRPLQYEPRPSQYDPRPLQSEPRPLLLDSYWLWRRLCETAKAFSSGSPDTEALACFFIRVIRSLAAQNPDLPFSAAITVAVEKWRKIPAFEREQYHVTARMFIELDEQNKRSDEDQMDKPTGKTSKRPKQAVQERPVEDLAERVLTEYSQVMDAVESKVSDGSEVNAADEEDVCALYLNQMFNNCDFTSEAGLDMDYINSLLSTDQNLTDLLKEESLDIFSSTIPEPVAGCSKWTNATVSKAQVQPSFAPQCEDHMTQHVSWISTSPALLQIQNNDDQNAFQTLTSNPHGQETVNSARQDFVPEADGNSSGQKDETSYIGELNTTVQSNCLSLQNYKAHNATFTHAIQHLKSPASGGRAKEKRNEDTDIPNASQRNNATETQTNINEKDVKRNNKQKRGRRRRKQKKIPALDERTTSKSDGRTTKTAQNQRKTPERQQAIGKNGDHNRRRLRRFKEDECSGNPT